MTRVWRKYFFLACAGVRITVTVDCPMLLAISSSDVVRLFGALRIRFRYSSEYHPANRYEQWCFCGLISVNACHVLVAPLFSLA